jgi:hypothetical protein
MRLPNGYRWLYVTIEDQVIRFLVEEITDPDTRDHLREKLASEPDTELDVTELSPEGQRQVLHALGERLVPAALAWYAEDPHMAGSVGAMKQLWLMAEDTLRQEDGES